MQQQEIHIAVCSDIKETWDNRLFDPEINSKFVGCGWAGHLRRIWKLGNVVTGDVATKMVAQNRWKPTSVLIIQSEESKPGATLEKLGCSKFHYICWESPLYAFKTYDTFRKSATNYRFSNHAQWCIQESSDTSQARSQIQFACLQGSQLAFKESRELHKERHRKVALIASYKPLRSELNRCLLEKEWKSAHLGLITDLRRLKSPTYRQAAKLQTHWKRIDLLNHLLANELGDIYGSNWPIGNSGSCSDKIKTLQQYELSIALENCIWPGYHTEKIPQAIYAGSIPVADVDHITSQLVPKECFIDIQGLSPQASIQLIKETLHSPSKLQSLREAGREYLCMSDSRLYFEEDFSEEVRNNALIYISENRQR